MSINRNTLLEHVHHLLNIDAFTDYCVNGLQVEGTTHIQSIVSGVSANLELFEAAVEKHADLVLVHHGLFWKNSPHPFSLTGYLRKRVASLISHDINLVAYHLPLDAHPKLGNNAWLCELLQLKIDEPFDVGFLCHPTHLIGIDTLFNLVQKNINPNAQRFGRGPETINKVVVVSGGPSPDDVLRAARVGAEVFICGVVSEPVVALTKELGIHYVNAGHYNTEKGGVIRLGDYLAETFKLTHTFIDIPNPV